MITISAKDVAALRARTGAGMGMEATDVAEEVARSRDRPTLGVWLERRFSGHPGYDIQVSAPGGAALFRSRRIKADGLPAPSVPPEEERPSLESFTGRSGHARLLSRVVAGPLDQPVGDVSGPGEAGDAHAEQTSRWRVEQRPRGYR